MFVCVRKSGATSSSANKIGFSLFFARENYGCIWGFGIVRVHVYYYFNLLILWWEFSLLWSIHVGKLSNHIISEFGPTQKELNLTWSQRLCRQWCFLNILSSTFLENIILMTNPYPLYYSVCFIWVDLKWYFRNSSLVDSWKMFGRDA